MAYATVADAGFKLSSCTHDGNAQSGVKRVTYEKIVEREVMGPAEEDINPISRPVSSIDARVVHSVLDGTDMVAHAATAGNCVSNFKGADDGSGSITFGPMVANGFTFTGQRGQGGFPYEQEFVHEGSSLTETIAI